MGTQTRINRSTAGVVVRALLTCAFAALMTVNATAQSVALAAREHPVRAVATVVPQTPFDYMNCGLNGSQTSWNSGAVFVDTLGIRTASQRSLALGWCSYLASAQFDETIASYVRWSDAQLGDQLPIDLGIELARRQFGQGRIHFSFAQTDTTATERFIVETVIETRDAADWKVQAVHTINATVYRDTVRFESTLIRRLASSMRLISSPIEFVRLGGGDVDPARAKAATEFVSGIRKRLAIESPPGEQIVYLFTTSDNARELLGFSQFSGVTDGLSAATPSPFVLSMAPTTGEEHWHELVHAALFPRTPKLNSVLEESIAKVLSRSLQQSSPQVFCDDRLALYIDYMMSKSGDAALRTLVNGTYDLTMPTAAETSLAGIMGVPVADFVKGVAEYSSQKSVAQGCGR